MGPPPSTASPGLGKTTLPEKNQGMPDPNRQTRSLGSAIGEVHQRSQNAPQRDEPGPGSRSTLRSAAANLTAGQVVDGKYRLVRPLGRGGMSQVWLALHENLKTELAIKFVDERLTSDDETAHL